MKTEEKERRIKHLYSRACFGISYEELTKAKKVKWSKVIRQLLDSTNKPLGISIIDKEELNDRYNRNSVLVRKKDLTKEENEEKKIFVKFKNAKSHELNFFWLKKMSTDAKPFIEKMTLFWHGHFACRTDNPYFDQHLNNVIRENATGNFKSLVIAVSKAPAMLQFLNNQQSRKSKPNENFARELMELFTLGRGNYTEKDIKEAAKSFTGWAYNSNWEYEFNEKNYDDGIKTVFGVSGKFGGEEIIDIILKKKETAVFIAGKLYKFFVSDEENSYRIKELGLFFYENNYEIIPLLEKIFTSNWFYDESVVGTKIKSPVEFLVGLNRTFFIHYPESSMLIQFQSNLGQYLFKPPNVAGWPGGQNWIDSSSLILRMKIPSIVLNNGVMDSSGKADPEDEAVIALSKSETDNTNNDKIQVKVNAQVDWSRFLAAFPKGFEPLQLVSFLLQPTLNKRALETFADNKGLKSTAIEVTSRPEYQLC